MSHHKKGRTIHKENKRLDHKKARAAERQVLGSGQPRQVRFDTWSYRPDCPPVIDDGEAASTRPSPKKKTRPKKDRCPDNPKSRAHEFLLDDPVEDSSRYGAELRQDRICVWCGQEASRWTFVWGGGWSNWGGDDSHIALSDLAQKLGIRWTRSGFRVIKRR